ncbi:MAG: diguanylate cyclase [Proteobacteria bacterium]|nr:diguanylate cyclase [Pseudomonadota bacterium]
MSDSATLQAENEALLGFLYMCPVGVLRTAANGDVEMINPLAAQLILPLIRQPILLNLFDALESFAPELRDMAARFVAPSGSICQQHRVFISSAGPGPRVIAFTLLKVKNNCLMAVLQDVTLQVDQERQLRQNEAMFAALVAGVNDFALFSLDGDGRIDSWNTSGERQTGFSRDEVMGRDLSIFDAVGNETRERVMEQIEDAAREGWSLRERWSARRNGDRYWCQIMVAANREVKGNDRSTPAERSAIVGYAVVLRDVTERRVTSDELRRLLTTDNLTGASNRARFFDLAETEIVRCRMAGRPISAIMLDVDHFKQVNDCFGHATGDALLRRLVELCRAQLRGRDVLARMGGEEFAILLPDADLDEAMAVAERIRLAVASSLHLPGPTCMSGDAWPAASVTVSLGCAALASHVAGIDGLLKSADEALYDAKRGGRDQVRADRYPDPQI